MRSQADALTLPPAAAATRAPAFARVAVHREADAAVLEAWAVLESLVPCSIYQTRTWLLPWIATLGRAAGIEPFFVVASSDEGTPLALLCLGLRRHGPVTIAEFLGGKDSNFNIGLLRPGIGWTADELRRLLAAAARDGGGTRPDAFLLANQPFTWAGCANPLAALPHQASPSAAFGTALLANAEALFADKLSKDSRKKLRKKETRLAEFGALAYRIAATDDERAAILDRFFVQRLDRFRAQGITSDFEGPAMRAFIAAASAPGPHGAAIDLHALFVDERIIAVYGGASHGGHWSGMFNSFDTDPEIAKSSPGDLLLMKVIAAQCAAGLSRFDLGVGEARYKATFCGEAIPLFDTFVPITATGWAFLKLQALALKTKRAVKQNTRLFGLAKRLRAALKPA